MAKLNFPQLLLQSSVSHNPSEIIDNNTDDNKEMCVTGVKAALLSQE